MKSPYTSAEFAAYLHRSAPPLLDERPLLFTLHQRPLLIQSNAPKLLQQLQRYFGSYITLPSPEQQSSATPRITLLEAPPFSGDPALPLQVWPHEAGKQGRKEAWFDLSDGRLIHKVRSGVLFLQHPHHLTAFGPCLAHESQIINFILVQSMNSLQQQGWLICHASGLDRNGEGLAIAGVSGGGKSTLMLKLLEEESIRFVSNDRLFLRRDSHGIPIARGIPKLPRINPGTIIHNRRLQPLLSASRREQLRQLPSAELRQLEEKYDVDIERFYGQGRMRDSTTLRRLLLLNWSPRQGEALRLQPVDLEQRQELLKGIMKSPGPFFHTTEGHYQQPRDEIAIAPYLQQLQGVEIYEATGTIDFEKLQQLCYQQLI